jgi:hypothetical protein
MHDKKEKPRAGGQRGALLYALPTKARGHISTEMLARAQPVSFGGRFVGWIRDHASGQFEAAAYLDGSLGLYTSASAAIHALVAHAGANGQAPAA